MGGVALFQPFSVSLEEVYPPDEFGSACPIRNFSTAGSISNRLRANRRRRSSPNGRGERNVLLGRLPSVRWGLGAPRRVMSVRLCPRSDVRCFASTSAAVVTCVDRSLPLGRRVSPTRRCAWCRRLVVNLIPRTVTASPGELTIPPGRSHPGHFPSWAFPPGILNNQVSMTNVSNK